MNRFVEGILIFFGVGLIFLGLIFVIAGDITDILTGGVMIGIGLVMFVLIYAINRIQASKPKLISQTFNVKMEGSGKLEDKQMKCKSCGASLTEKDLKVIQGGIMVTCPYCGVVSALNEEPKW